MTFFLDKEKDFLTSTRILGVSLQHLRRQLYAQVELERQKLTVSLWLPLIYTSIFDMDKRVLSQYTELDLGYYSAVFPAGKYRQ